MQSGVFLKTRQTDKYSSELWVYSPCVAITDSELSEALIKEVLRAYVTTAEKAPSRLMATFHHYPYPCSTHTPAFPSYAKRVTQIYLVGRSYVW